LVEWRQHCFISVPRLQRNHPDFNRQFFEEFDVTNPEGITITGLWSQNLIPSGSAGSILERAVVDPRADDCTRTMALRSAEAIRLRWTPNGAFVVA